MSDLNLNMINQITLSLSSGFLGAFIGGWITKTATLEAAKIAHENNLNLEEKKAQSKEKAVILSILEELKVLKSSYEDELDKDFAKVDKGGYLKTTYTTTQDYMVIYHNNVNNIGLIDHENLRSLLVKTYMGIKIFLDEMSLYSEKLQLHRDKRRNFLYYTFKEDSMYLLEGFDLELSIDLIKRRKIDELKTSKCPNLNQEEIDKFIFYDNEYVGYLYEKSIKLNHIYINIKDDMNKTISLAETKYIK